MEALVSLLGFKPYDMAALYEQYPALKIAELAADPRLERRSAILKHILPFKKGAEIGVFTGQFSEYLLHVTKPKEFYAVDPWHLLFGEFFQDWGEYTARGTLATVAAIEATKARLSKYKNAKYVVSFSLDWIKSIERGSLDWVYIDSSHQYEQTLQELIAVADILAPDGIVLGDDCWSRRDFKHYGVFRAVRDFLRQKNFEIIEMAAGQWAARRTLD